MNDYHVLGLTPTASLADVRAAYKAKALLYHPDRESGNADLFKQCHKAYTSIQQRMEGGGLGSHNHGSSTAASSSSFRGKPPMTPRTSSFASTWSGLGTDTTTHRTTATAANGGGSSTPPPHPSSSNPTTPASASSSQRQRSFSFMNPTTSSKNQENRQKVTRMTPSGLAPTKPSTLGSEYCKPKNQRGDGEGGSSGVGADASAAPSSPTFLKTIGLAVRFQKADLTEVILDVSPQAFAAVKGSHLKFKARISRRTDGMMGTVAGILPATGAFYWHKENSTYVSLAAGVPADYVVTAPPPSVGNSASTSAANTPAKGVRGAQQRATATTAAGGRTPPHQPSATTSPPPPPPSTATPRGAGGDGNSSSTTDGVGSNVGKFIDPFAVTDSTNTLYFSSPLERRQRAVSGVFGTLGGGGDAVNGNNGRTTAAAQGGSASGPATPTAGSVSYSASGSFSSSNYQPVGAVSRTSDHLGGRLQNPNMAATCLPTSAAGMSMNAADLRHGRSGSGYFSASSSTAAFSPNTNTSDSYASPTYAGPIGAATGAAKTSSSSGGAAASKGVANLPTASDDDDLDATISQYLHHSQPRDRASANVTPRPSSTTPSSSSIPNTPTSTTKANGGSHGSIFGGGSKPTSPPPGVFTSATTGWPLRFPVTAVPVVRAPTAQQRPKY